MNVIFLDFDGTLHTFYDMKLEYELKVPKEEILKRIEKRIETLADICKQYDCKVVIEASAKDAMDEETMEIQPEAEWVQNILNMFRRHGIDCIGRTPNVARPTGPHSEYSMWKEDEIRLYLYRHPEIEHYAILDDDDTKTVLHWKRSDLDKVRNHLVLMPYHYEEKSIEEGIQPFHKEEIGRVLKKDNEIRKMVLAKKEQPLPNSGTIKTKDIFAQSEQLQEKKWELEKLKRAIKQQQAEMEYACPHEIVFKFNNNRPRKKPIDGYYYCPACGKKLLFYTAEAFQYSVFKESQVIPLNLSLNNDEETLNAISWEVSKNADLYYSSILTTEEMSARMEAKIADEEYDYNKPLEYRKKYSRRF